LKKSIKLESKLKDFAETSDNPFDNQKSITGLGNKIAKTPTQKRRQKLKDRIDKGLNAFSSCSTPLLISRSFSLILFLSFSLKVAAF